MKTHHYLYAATIFVLTLICLFFCKLRPVPPVIEHPQNTQSIIDSIRIEQLENNIELQRDSIDSLLTVKQKIKVITKTVTVYVDSLTFAETVKVAVDVFDSIEIIPRQNDTLFGLSTAQMKQAITTDTTLKLYKAEAIINDSIIEVQARLITGQDTIIKITKRQSDMWENAYYNASDSYATEHTSKKKWRLAAIIGGAYIIVREGAALIVRVVGRR